MLRLKGFRVCRNQRAEHPSALIHTINRRLASVEAAPRLDGLPRTPPDHPQPPELLGKPATSPHCLYSQAIRFQAPAALVRGRPQVEPRLLGAVHRRHGWARLSARARGSVERSTPARSRRSRAAADRRGARSDSGPCHRRNPGSGSLPRGGLRRSHASGPSSRRRWDRRSSHAPSDGWRRCSHGSSGRHRRRLSSEAARGDSAARGGAPRRRRKRPIFHSAPPDRPPCSGSLARASRLFLQDSIRIVGSPPLPLSMLPTKEPLPTAPLSADPKATPIKLGSRSRRCSSPPRSRRA